MAEVKWTKGPWTWSAHWLHGADIASTILYYTTDDDGVHCSNDADAPLIAAAPELYEALNRADAYLALHAAVGDKAAAYITTLSGAALAKARGES